MKKKLSRIDKKVKIKFVKDRPGHDVRYALNSKKIIGACLDVLDVESSNFNLNKAKNQSFEKLKKFNNVVLSPHIAGWSYESKEKMAQVILEKIHRKFIL